MRRPQEFGYDSWIRLYDHLKHQHQQAQTFLLQVPPPRGFVYCGTTVKPKKISMKTLERYCWQELQGLRINSDDSRHAVGLLVMGNQLQQQPELTNNISKLLWKLEKTKR